jgi:hypothetical protein
MRDEGNDTPPSPASFAAFGKVSVPDASGAVSLRHVGDSR